MTGWHDDFAEYRPQTHADLESALQRALVVLDANVLLGLYRFGSGAREDLLTIFRALGPRLWVPHQAAREFWRSRLNVLDDRDDAAAGAKEAIERSQRAVTSALDVWAKKTVAATQVRDAIQHDFDEAVGALLGRIGGAGQQNLAATYDASTDTVVSQLDALLGGLIGAAPDPAEFAEWVSEGQRRVKAQIPPGYLDAEKEVTVARPEGAAGDYIVWRQALSEAARRQCTLLLVTGDEKQDWWWRHRSTFVGPRVELRREFQREVPGCQFYMMRPSQLIEYSAVLDVATSMDSAADIDRVTRSSGPGRWTNRAVLELLSRLDAEGASHQGKVIRRAAQDGGIIDRQTVYEICGFSNERGLQGFTRPAHRITRILQQEGILDSEVEPVLTPRYDGSQVADFEIPLDVVEVLSGEIGVSLSAGAELS